ncbi:hypothetical protein FQN60_015784, partial [Etheostoma spectabile]
MASAQGLCPHQSVPVEMDESMTSSSLDLVLPPSCKQCSGHTETSRQLQEHGYEQARGAADNVSQWRLPESLHQHEPRGASHVAPGSCLIPVKHSGERFADVLHHGLREQTPLYVRDFQIHQSGGFASPSNWPQDHSVEEAEHLEPPQSLKSGPNPMQGSRLRQCACCPPANLPRHNNIYYHQEHGYPADPCKEPQHHQPSWTPPCDRQQRDAAPGSVAPLRDVMHEVLDTAKEILPFTKFLIDQGFKPAIDIFDNPMQIMGITKWMDRYLNDKSVLIIVVISPKYKEDVEGDGDDEHGLHTKYIHNQIYRWPQDTQDLLLRLLREERYIIPQQGADLTLTV